MLGSSLKGFRWLTGRITANRFWGINHQMRALQCNVARQAIGVVEEVARRSECHAPTASAAQTVIGARPTAFGELLGHILGVVKEALLVAPDFRETELAQVADRERTGVRRAALDVAVRAQAHDSATRKTPERSGFCRARRDCRRAKPRAPSH